MFQHIVTALGVLFKMVTLCCSIRGWLNSALYHICTFHCTLCHILHTLLYTYNMLHEGLSIELRNLILLGRGIQDVTYVWVVVTMSVMMIDHISYVHVLLSQVILRKVLRLIVLTTYKNVVHYLLMPHLAMTHVSLWVQCVCNHIELYEHFCRYMLHQTTYWIQC